MFLCLKFVSRTSTKDLVSKNLRYKSVAKIVLHYRMSECCFIRGSYTYPVNGLSGARQCFLHFRGLKICILALHNDVYCIPLHPLTGIVWLSCILYFNVLCICHALVSIALTRYEKYRQNQTRGQQELCYKVVLILCSELNLQKQICMYSSFTASYLPNVIIFLLLFDQLITSSLIESPLFYFSLSPIQKVQADKSPSPPPSYPFLFLKGG